MILFDPPPSRRDKRVVHAFPNDISQKVNVIKQLEIALAYIKASIHQFNSITQQELPLYTFCFEKKVSQILDIPNLSVSVWYPKTQKNGNTQHYKVRIKSKVEQSRE